MRIGITRIDTARFFLSLAEIERNIVGPLKDNFPEMPRRLRVLERLRHEWRDRIRRFKIKHDERQGQR
jgi:hypothetical protein